MLAFFHMIAARIRGFLGQGGIESDFDQEIAAHLQMAEEDGLRRGLTAEEARRAARVQLGGITQLRESWREAWGLPWLDGFALDAKLGLRMLRRSWGLTLAGGLAMTIVITIAAVFSTNSWDAPRRRLMRASAWSPFRDGTRRRIAGVICPDATLSAGARRCSQWKISVGFRPLSAGW